MSSPSINAKLSAAVRFPRDLEEDLLDRIERREAPPKELLGLDLADPHVQVSCGYRFEDRGSEEPAAPLLSALLCHLAHGGQHLTDSARALFDDLWRVDYGVAMLLERSADPQEIARAWRQSPGRRLLWDLSLLSELPPTDLAAMASAAGPIEADPWTSKSRMHQRWCDDHSAVPGAQLPRWEPCPLVGSQEERRSTAPPPLPEAVGVLQILEDGVPVSRRAAALHWILAHAMDQPFYEVPGGQRDLRRDMEVPILTSLSPGLAWCLASALRDNRHHALRWSYEAAHLLETFALQHAARLSAGQPASATWRLARWIVSCLLSSPFHVGDLQARAFALKARLPEPLPEPAADADPLDPGRFRADGRGLDLAEVIFLDALHAHYHLRPPRPVLSTLPEVARRALVQIASRPVNEGERAAEARLQQLRAAARGSAAEAAPLGDLGWSAPLLAPPLLSRYLLSHRESPWVAEALGGKNGNEVLAEIETALGDSPDEMLEWLATPFYSEGRNFPSEVRSRLAQLIASLEHASTLSRRGELAIFGAGVLSALPDGHLLIRLCEGGGPLRISAFYLVGKAAAQEDDGALFELVLRRLSELCLDNAQPVREQIGAASGLLRCLEPERLPLDPAGRQRWRKWAKDYLNVSPFVDQVQIRRLLRGQGLLRDEPA